MTSFPSPNIRLLRSFLIPQASLISNSYFPKAVRCYTYCKALYDQGGCSVNNFPYSIKFVPKSEAHPFSPTDFQNDCIQFNQTPLGIHDNNLITLQTFKARDLLFSTPQDEESWKKSLKENYPDVINTQIEELLDSFPFKNRSTKPESLAKLIRLDFETLAEKQWITRSTIAENNKRTYYKINQKELEEKLKPYQDRVSSATQEKTGRFFSNEDITDFIRRFSLADDTRILFESECLFSQTIPLDNFETILDTLEQNWFNCSQTQPIQLSYKEKETQTVNTVITYPVTFVYIKRTFYLYGIESAQNDWQSYRIDRIYSAEILDWNDSKVPNTLKTLFHEDDLPIIDKIQDELQNNALGYAFWKTQKIMLLQFEKHHYNLHIRNNQRSEIFREINLNNFEDIYKQVGQNIPPEDKQKTRQQIVSILKKAQANSPDNQYIYCLATYYEQEIAVLQRLLAWGKKVKVVFPATLQQEILEELRSTLKLYELNP